MNIGKLNQRIALLDYRERETDYGIVTELQTMASCWAYIQPLRGREYYQANKIIGVDNYKITIRFRENVNTAMLVKYKEKILEIQSVADVDCKHEKLELYCAEKKEGLGDEQFNRIQGAGTVSGGPG